MTTGYIDLPTDVGGTVDLTTEVTGILPIANGGTGSATQNFVDLTTGQTVAGAKTFTGTPTAFTPTASTTAATTRFLFTGAADTTLTASTEAPSTYFNLGQTRQHATGALSLQRDFRITPSTHSFVGTSTLTTASAFSIDGPVNGGTNATITNSSALYVPTSLVTNVTNSYGVNVAATTGATNNYAGVFTGGNLGIGTATPTSLLHALENNSATGSSNGITIEQSGTGDAVHHFLLTAGQRYTMGIDNSDSDKFKIGTNADLGTSNLLTVTTTGMLGIGTASPGTLIHAATTNATAYTPTSGALAIPANVLQTIENLDTTDATAALLSFVSRSGGAVNRTFIGNVSNSAGGSIVFGHRTGTTAYAERMRIDYLGNLGIGTSSPNANALLDVSSTTKASMPVPRMTTAQKGSVASPAAGMMVYDTTLNKLCVYTTAWETITSV